MHSKVARLLLQVGRCVEEARTTTGDEDGLRDRAEDGVQEGKVGSSFNNMHIAVILVARFALSTSTGNWQTCASYPHRDTSYSTPDAPI